MPDPEELADDSYDHLLCALRQVRIEYGDHALHRFAAACCRRIWHLLSDPRSRAAVEVAERYHAGRAEIEEVDVAREGAWEARDLAASSDEPSICRGVKEAHAKAAAYVVNTEPPDDDEARFGHAEDDAAWVLLCAADAAAHAKWVADTRLPWEARKVDWDTEYEKEREAQRRLFREHFGQSGMSLP